MGQFESLAGNDMAPATNFRTDNFLTLESGLLFMIENVLSCTIILACFATLSRMSVTCTCHLPKNNTDHCWGITPLRRSPLHEVSALKLHIIECNGQIGKYSWTYQWPLDGTLWIPGWEWYGSRVHHTLHLLSLAPRISHVNSYVHILEFVSSIARK